MDDDVAVERIPLDVERFCVMWQTPKKLDRSEHAMFYADAVLWRAAMEFATERLESWRYPAGWWQAFKHRWFPAFLLRWFPVRWVVWDIRAVYPFITLRNREPFILRRDRKCEST